MSMTEIERLEKRIHNLEMISITMARFIEELLPRGNGREDDGPVKDDMDRMFGEFFGHSETLGGFKDKAFKDDKY